MGDAAMKRDEVSAMLGRMLAEAIGGGVDGCPAEHVVQSGRSPVRVELHGLSLQVNRITVDFPGLAERRSEGS